MASNTEVNARDNHVMTSVHLEAALGGSVTGSFTDATCVVRGCARTISYQQDRREMKKNYFFISLPNT